MESKPQITTGETELRTPQQQLQIDIHEAASYGDFWSVVDAYKQGDPDVSDDRVNALYDDWRRRYINEKSLANARAIVEASAQFMAPLSVEGCDSVVIEPQAAHVAYNSTTELVADLRFFFAPHREQNEEKRQDELECVQKASQSYLYRHLAYTDNAITDRIEQELTDWEQQGSQGAYVDSQAGDDGHPYRDALGKTHYDNKTVRVTCDENGQFLLGITGGHAAPTQSIQEFAAYCGKELTYTGPVLLRYVSAPFARHSANTTGEDAAPTVVGKLPIVAIRRHLQAAFGVSDKVVANLEEVLYDMSRKYVPSDEATMRDEKIKMRVTPSTMVPRDVSFTKDGRSYYGGMRYYKTSDETRGCFELPKVELLAEISNPARASEIIGVLYAQHVVARQEYAGYDDGFVINDMFYANPIDEFGQPFSHLGSATTPQGEVAISQPQLSPEELARQQALLENAVSAAQQAPEQAPQDRLKTLRWLGSLLRKLVR